jgi:ABC-type antimicrobial peptide transport system permease subunit
LRIQKDDKIRSILPDNLELVQAQCIRDFVQQTNLQTLSFLNAWSIAVYAAVSAASYTIATRLITESSYELTMLSALGAKKRLIFALILCYTTTVALIGSILGISLGVAGAQIASTLLRWAKKHGNIPVSRSPSGISNPSSNPSFISFRVHLPSS